MGGTSAERYAVVSCHVERPLDDRVWSRFTALQARHPGGFRIAGLLRPADAAAGEDEGRWHERAEEAASLGPLGHHTHWTAPDHARPTLERRASAGERVRAEGGRLRELGLAPTAFCGGGWYTDPDVAGACAELGYADCTPRALRPQYLLAGEPWASLAAPARIRLASERRLVAVPTTHSLGDLVRALRARALPSFVHVYFHDTDLTSRRAALLPLALRLLARRSEVGDVDALAARTGDGAPVVGWDDVARL